MPANDPATILLSGLDWAVRREVNGSGVIIPGMLVERAAGVVQAHSTAQGVNQRVFVRRNSTAGGVDGTYADGDLIRLGYAQSGDQVNAILNAGSAIAEDDLLASDGAGGVITAVAVTGAELVGVALEGVSDPSTGYARVKVETF